MIRQVPAFLFLTAATFATGQEKELPVLVRSFAAVDKPAPAFEEGKFVPKKGETIAFIGGTNTFDQQRFGYLEWQFQISWPDRELKIRNLGWQGDTIYHQARPRFFYTREGDPQPGSSPDTRARTIPGIIVINFGKIESLEGIESLPKFLAAYEALLDQLEARTRRIILVGPTPFFPVGPAASQTDTRNEVLHQFIGRIRETATDRGFLFVDTFTPFLSKLDPGLSTNGTHLSETGHLGFADRFARQLDFPYAIGTELRSSAGESLRRSILRKNRLWHQYYHPTNWAFLFGDRQHVPASRDHEDTKKRWFLKEVDALPPLIAETEADIYRYAGEATKAGKR